MILATFLCRLPHPRSWSPFQAPPSSAPSPPSAPNKPPRRLVPKTLVTEGSALTQEAACQEVTMPLKEQR